MYLRCTNKYIQIGIMILIRIHFLFLRILKLNTMKFQKFFVLFSALFFSIIAFSQNKGNVYTFTKRGFYQPFVSEISSTLNDISLGKSSSNKFSGRDSKKLVVNEVHLGFDMPLLYVEKSNFKWAMSLPVSIHMIWAPFDKITSPIINNDYRFGLSFAGSTNLNNSYIKNLSFKVTPFAHESAHLGDELTIDGFQSSDKFFRINVSYEYYELGLTLNDPEILEENTLSFRIGFIGLIRPNVGYYTYFENEIGDATLYPSKRWAEYYLELNYKKTNGFLANKQWHPNVSFELRNRIKYEYEKEEKENRIWCVNAYVGYDFVPKKINAVKSIGHYFRYYQGVNPHGQLRNGTANFIGYSAIVYI